MINCVGYRFFEKCFFYVSFCSSIIIISNLLKFILLKYLTCTKFWLNRKLLPFTFKLYHRAFCLFGVGRTSQLKCNYVRFMYNFVLLEVIKFCGYKAAVLMSFDRANIRDLRPNWKKKSTQVNQSSLLMDRSRWDMRYCYKLYHRNICK